MDLRRVCREYKANKISEEDYVTAIKEEISKVVKLQEELVIDVLVHGESERNDMVEYLGEQLSGFAFTANGWEQYYGTRCVKPPIIYGDVSRPKAMTVFWSSMAQSMISRPMKGMLTGPVTILNWSFVRNDQPRFETCYQIALAIKKEVEDLEAAGITIINLQEQSGRFNFTTHFQYYNEIFYMPDFTNMTLGKPVIFDMDMSGGDILAILYLLKVPVEIMNLKGISLSTNGWANAATIDIIYDALHMMGRDDIPVGLGNQTALGTSNLCCEYFKAIPHGSGGFIDSDTLFGLARTLPRSP